MSSNVNKKPGLLVARQIYPDVLERLKAHFDVDYNHSDEVLSSAELTSRLQGKAAAMTTGTERIDAEVLKACPELRICANIAVGYNNFDVSAMSEHRVQATNTPDVLTETTADFGFALMMATSRRLTESEHFLRKGLWKKWSLDMFTSPDVHGTTLGILGMGRIGQAIAKRGAFGFSMNVIYHNRSRLSEELERECKARYVSKEDLLKQCDHLVLVLPYTAQAHHTIGEGELRLMKPTATLTNIARGGIVDDAALAKALRAGVIASAGLDVFEGEPQVHPDLLTLPNVVLTPHIASASTPTRRAMANLAADNLIAFAKGEPVLNPVNTV
jgi:gluconate 2-dehydrogenase